MKKRIFRLLCNEITGKLISFLFANNIPNSRYGFRRYKTPEAYCSNTVKAMIFWGFYESAEMRLIPKYIVPDLPVVELGASLGIVSSLAIGHIKNETAYTCIEANPFLIEYIETNIKKFHPQKELVAVQNLALAYNDTGFVDIHITNNNTQGRISYEPNAAAKHIQVKTTSLRPYSRQHYTLICDIEGMEIEMIQHDKEALQNCRHLFIELHKAWYLKDIYEVDQLKALILDLGFTLVERDGNVFYFNKPTSK